MSTPYSNVFSVFTSKIQDDMYSNLTQSEAEADMIDLLNNAIPNFEYPKIDIRNKDDERQEFAEDLSLDEVNILGNLMLLEWIERQIYNVNLLKQSISSKDFKITSQASHLNSLENLQEKTRIKVDRLKRRYSYRKRGSSYNQPDFSGLGGDDG